MNSYRLVVFVCYSKEWFNSFDQFYKSVAELKGVFVDTPKNGMISLESEDLKERVIELSMKHKVQIKLLEDENI